MVEGQFGDPCSDGWVKVVGTRWLTEMKGDQAIQGFLSHLVWHCSDLIAGRWCDVKLRPQKQTERGNTLGPKSVIIIASGVVIVSHCGHQVVYDHPIHEELMMFPIHVNTSDSLTIELRHGATNL
jgi:hypothetical protein